jgi:hypothetical protein
MAFDPAELKRMREQYRRTREAVDAAFAQEVASMTEEEGLKRVQRLELPPFQRMPSRESSGLIQQQALFQRLASRR